MSKMERFFWLVFVWTPIACIVVLLAGLIIGSIKQPEAKVQFEDAAMKGWIEANLSDALARRGLHVYCVLKYTNVGDTVVINRGTDLIVASSKEEAECLFNERTKK